MKDPKGHRRQHYLCIQIPLRMLLIVALCSHDLFKMKKISRDNEMDHEKEECYV